MTEESKEYFINSKIEGYYYKLLNISHFKGICLLGTDGKRYNVEKGTFIKSLEGKYLYKFFDIAKPGGIWIVGEDHKSHYVDKNFLEIEELKVEDRPNLDIYSYKCSDPNERTEITFISDDFTKSPISSFTNLYKDYNKKSNNLYNIINEGFKEPFKSSNEKLELNNSFFNIDFIDMSFQEKNEKNELKNNSNSISLPLRHSGRKIVFDKDYFIELSKNFEILVNHLPFRANVRKKIKEKALNLFKFTLEHRMKPTDLDSKNAGVLSVIFIFFSLLFYDYIKINNRNLSYGTICRLLGKDLELINLSDCKARSMSRVARFLPEDLIEKYYDFHSKKIYTGRLSYKQFIDYIRELGFKKTGIEGKALCPYIDHNKFESHQYQELTSEEYYSLIENKKGTEIRIPVWCGKKEHKPWNGILSNLLQEKWCHKCVDEEKITFTLERLILLARERGIEETGIEGKILESKENSMSLTIDTYNRLIKNLRPSKTHFWWNCNIKGHPPWKTTPEHIFFDKSWCPICKTGLYTYDELIKLANERGFEETGVEGKILELKESNESLTIDTYKRLKNNKKPSEISFWWSCERGHPHFRNNPANIRRGQWCPICSSESGKFKNIIQGYFQNIFGAYFQESYLRDLNLKFLRMNIDLDLSKRNSIIVFKGYKVEFLDVHKIDLYKGKMRFDGFADILINDRRFKIAFEYNGIQHYEFPNYWFKNSKDGLNSWLKYIKRDQMKKEICKLNNIVFIEFPYYVDRSLDHPEKIQSFIIKQFESKTGLKLCINKNYNHRSSE